MTTPSPDDSTVRFSDRKIQTRSSTRPAAETDWSGWEAWLAARLDQRCETFGEEVVEAIAQQMTDPLEKRIRVLETELAQTRGMLDVVRAKGEPQAAGELGDLIRETTTPLETRLRDLELECAQQRGVVDILRGKGLPGCLRVRGTYSASSSYQALDVVVRDSSSFVALRDNPGACPGDGWQLIACGGKRGVAGEKGERGPKGDKGDAPVLKGASFNLEGMQIQTDRGPIPLFKTVKVDPRSFTIKIVGSDDSSLTVDLAPMFREYDAQKKP
jgi:hypothetical protein